MAGVYALGTAHMPPPMPTGAGAPSAATAAGANGTGIASLSNAPTGPLGSTLESLRSLVQKRKTAWSYLKNAADGRVYWFNVRLPGSILAAYAWSTG